MPDVCIVVPVYRSSESLRKLVEQTHDALAGSDWTWSVLFVDDRSPNAISWPTIQHLAHQHANVGGLRLLKNRGRASAVFCGLRHVAATKAGSYAIIMDDDLQHSPADIPRLLGELADNGETDVAVAQFQSKQHSTLARVGSMLKAQIDRHYYGLSPDIRMSSFVAMRPTVVRAMAESKSSFPLVGPQLIQLAGRLSGVACTHLPREDGEPAYTLRKRISQFLRIFLSDTIVILKAFTRLGVALSIVSVAVALYFLVIALFTGRTPEGWASLFVTTSFLGGINMLLLGLIGINLIRTKQTTENYPAWNLREAVGFASTPAAGLRAGTSGRRAGWHPANAAGDGLGKRLENHE